MLRACSLAMKSWPDLLIPHVVQQDLYALVDHHVGVGELYDVRTDGELVLGAWSATAGNEFAREARDFAALRVDPDLDQVGALGGELRRHGRVRLPASCSRHRCPAAS